MKLGVRVDKTQIKKAVDKIKAGSGRLITHDDLKRGIELDNLKKKYQEDWIYTPELLEILTEKLGYKKEKAQEMIKEWDKERGLGKSFGESFGGWDDIQKALFHKYIRRVPKKSGKGYWYVYAETFKKPFAALKQIFSVKSEKIDTDFDKHNIKKAYGADKKTFAAHILEYLCNKFKWDKIFSVKENRDKYKKPEKQTTVSEAVSDLKNDTPEPASSKKTKTSQKEKPPLVVNRSLMRKIWEIYNPKKAQEAAIEDKKTVDDNTQTGDTLSIEGAENGERKNNTGTGSGELPADTASIRDRGSESAGNINVSSGGKAGNKGKSGGTADQSGGGSGGDFRERRGRSAIKDIREQVKKLLAEKKDDEFTDADKELLRQYEGGGGLAEKGASTHGTLYEFYTPKKVVDKVWELVDKYNFRRDRDVIEPSAGTGRFVEGRLEQFDLFELDETSARIAGILHPDANVKQGYFQDLFMNGRTPKKNYDGKKYDVAIGNPPYGKYSGMHSGLGEGKGHTRIEEYFIDRSLDTLKDGGILAMVVPSGFLRGGESKAKQAIAKKAKLLEAWRLPNGTFGTTGIGTDIIILRKEPENNVDRFTDNYYFNIHPEHIVGYESEKMGRFGMEKYVSPPDGMSFDEALDSINPEKVPYVSQGEKSPIDDAMEKVEVKSEAEEHQNRSDAMKGNKNAYKGGDDEYAVLSGHRSKKENNKEIVSLMKLDHAEFSAREVLNELRLKHGDDEAKNICHDYLYEVRKTKNTAEIKFCTELSQAMNDKPKTVLEQKIEDQKKTIQNTKKLYAGMKDGARLKDTTAKLIKLQEHTLKKLQHTQNLRKLQDEMIRISETDETSRTRSEAMQGNDNAAGSRGGGKKKGSTDDYTRSIGHNMTVDEYNKKYGIDVSTEDMGIWKATDYAGRIDISKLSDKERKHLQKSENFTVDAEGNWCSIVNYASGNIYEKLDHLERDKDKIISNMGVKVYEKNKALLEATKLPPKAAENIHISPIEPFAKEYRVDYEDGKSNTLRDAFLKWAGMSSYGYWNPETSPISQYEIPPIISFNDVVEYMNQKALRTDRATARETDSVTARMERAKKQDARRECAERLFNRFIREGMSEDQREKLVDQWNRRFNAIVNPDYTKIPVFVTGMNTHKGKKKFDFIKAQVEGVSFACNKGNGILVHSVGVGKTVQGEAIAVNMLNTERATRPLHIVPMAVMKKWVREYKQHFPDQEVICLGNLRKGSKDSDIAKYIGKDGKPHLPKGAVYIMTEEATEMITFKDETLDSALIDDFMDSQTVYDKDAQEKRTPKQLAEEREKVKKLMGMGAKAKEGAFYWEDLGLDCVIIDEIHGAKNVFGEARAFKGSNKTPDDKGQASNEFRGLTGSKPSNYATKIFAITQLIQRENNGQNVFGLSATPFTNSPIEVYNILSLVARNKLKDLHVYNMYDFLAQFADIKTEWSVTASGEVKEKQVMKRWKNLGALQNLVSEYMHYVDADEAGIIRPRKKPHTPELQLSPLQRAILDAEAKYMADADPKEDPGAYLKAINNMRMATLSPALIKPERYEYYMAKYPDLFGDFTGGFDIPTTSEFVTASPKMTFVCDSVAKFHKEKPQIGQIVYLPRGVEQYEHVKKYLMTHGMPMDSIAFMNGDSTLDEKERIMRDFNDVNGKIKVVIGSETIMQGVSLNGNTAPVYNCFLGWNPTEPIQVEGRAWRQGNKQAHVHVIYPLMSDSIDSLMYQKYDEKKSRIDEIWSFKGDVSRDVSDINPEELKFDLIKDPKKKAGMIVGQKREKIKSDIRVEEGRYDVLFKDRQLLERAERVLPEYKRDMDTAEAKMLKCREARDKEQKQFDKWKKEGWSKQELSGAQRAVDRTKYELDVATSEWREEKRYFKQEQDIIDAVQAKFRRLDIKPDKIDDKLKEIAAGIQELKDQEKAISDSYNEELEKAEKELKAARKRIPPLSSQIEENVASILGDLRDMNDEAKTEIKAELDAKRKVKKSFVVINNRLCIRAS
jgi:hypothetical protein